MDPSANEHNRFHSETPKDGALPKDAIMLLETLMDHPGATISEARQHSRLGRQRMTQALEDLLARHLAHHFTKDGRTYLFPSLPDIENWWYQVVTLRRPTLAELYREMDQSGDWRYLHLLDHMTEGFGWVRSTAQRRLRRLEEADLVESYQVTRDLRPRYYRTRPIHPKAEEILQKDGHGDL